jgi:fluoroquinolone transport system permease protein
MKGVFIRTTALLYHEIRLHWSQGIHALYFLFALLYIGLLTCLPPSWKRPAAAGLLLSDPTVLGFFFSGMILFWERDLFPALFITPLRPGPYLLVRAFSFLILSLLLSLAFLIPAFGLDYRPAPVLLGLILTAPFFTFLGMFLSFRFRDVISYLMAGGFLMSLFFLPLLELLPRWHFPIFLPTRSSLILFRIALGLGEKIPRIDVLVSSLIALGETAAVYLLCRRELCLYTAGRRNYD